LSNSVKDKIPSKYEEKKRKKNREKVKVRRESEFTPPKAAAAAGMHCHQKLWF
jgi:hypothetical protein